MSISKQLKNIKNFQHDVLNGLSKTEETLNLLALELGDGISGQYREEVLARYSKTKQEAEDICKKNTNS